jgi:hypothetical protein
LASPEMRLASQRIISVQFSVKKRMQDQFPIRQAPAELVLDWGEGGRIMPMRIARGNNPPTSSVKSLSGWLSRWS